MNFLERISRLNPDKIINTLALHIKDGEAEDVIEVLPQLTLRFPELTEQLADIHEVAKAKLASIAQAENPKVQGFNAVKSWQCPNCGYNTAVFNPATVAIICASCGSNSTEKNTTHNINNEIDHPFLALNQQFDFSGQRWQIIGYQQYRGKVTEYDHEDHRFIQTPWRYSTWWLVNEMRQMAWIVEDQNGFAWINKRTKQSKIPSDIQNYEVGEYKLHKAVGEFTYRCQLNEAISSYERANHSIEVRLNEANKPQEIESFHATGLSIEGLLQALGKQQPLEKIHNVRKASSILIGVIVMLIFGYFGLKMLHGGANDMITDFYLSSVSDSSQDNAPQRHFIDSFPATTKQIQLQWKLDFAEIPRPFDQLDFQLLLEDAAGNKLGAVNLLSNESDNNSATSSSQTVFQGKSNLLIPATDETLKVADGSYMLWLQNTHYQVTSATIRPKTKAPSVLPILWGIITTIILWTFVQTLRHRVLRKQLHL